MQTIPFGKRGLFQEFEHQFCDLLKAYQPQSAVSQELFKTEMKTCTCMATV